MVCPRSSCCWHRGRLSLHWEVTGILRSLPCGAWKRQSLSFRDMFQMQTQAQTSPFQMSHPISHHDPNPGSHPERQSITLISPLLACFGRADYSLLDCAGHGHWGSREWSSMLGCFRSRRWRDSGRQLLALWGRRFRGLRWRIGYHLVPWFIQY